MVGGACRTESEDSRREGSEFGIEGTELDVGGAGDGDSDGWSRERRLLDGGGGGGSGGTELGFDEVGREALDGTEGQGGGGLFLKEDEDGMALGLEEEGEGEDTLSLRGVGREALSFFV